MVTSLLQKKRHLRSKQRIDGCVLFFFVCRVDHLSKRAYLNGIKIAELLE